MHPAVELLSFPKFHKQNFLVCTDPHLWLTLISLCSGFSSITAHNGACSGGVRGQKVISGRATGSSLQQGICMGEHKRAKRENNIKIELEKRRQNHTGNSSEKKKCSQYSWCKRWPQRSGQSQGKGDDRNMKYFRKCKYAPLPVFRGW